MAFSSPLHTKPQGGIIKHLLCAPVLGAENGDTVFALIGCRVEEKQVERWGIWNGLGRVTPGEQSTA